MKRSLLYYLGCIMCLLVARPAMAQVANQNFNALTTTNTTSPTGYTPSPGDLTFTCTTGDNNHYMAVFNSNDNNGVFLSAFGITSSLSNYAYVFNADITTPGNAGTGTDNFGFRSATNNPFKLVSMVVDGSNFYGVGPGSNAEFIFTGYKNGVAVTGATGTIDLGAASTTSGSISFSQNDGVSQYNWGTLTFNGTFWQNIDEVRITGTGIDQALAIDNLVFSSAVVTSVAAPLSKTYKTGDAVNFTVNFDAAVTVTGTPTIPVTIGSTAQTASYASGSGTSALVFSYTVQSGDLDNDGVALGTAISLAGGTIKDASTVNANLTLNSIASMTGVLIDGVAPTVTSVNASTANGTYKTGDVISVQVNFSEAVTVTGTPQLTLETGTIDRVVNYASGSGTSAPTFTYTVQAGDVSADLDYQSTTALALNGGTIKDAAGNSATLTLASPGAANSLGNNKAIVIDAVAPTVTSVNSSTANGTYKTGDVVSVQVNFSEAITVTGTPQLTLETGTTDQVVNYASGSGTSTLTFTYTVQAGDVSADLDYQSTTALALNGGTIKDAAGNSATLTLASPGAANSLGNNKAIVIDAVAPTVTSVNASTANGTYKTGDAISVQVNFSEAVTVTGTPQLTLETGTTDEVVNYASGSGTSTLTFTYTVQAGDQSADLDYQSTTALALNGGTIKDAAGNNATLTLVAPGAANSLGNNKAIVVDAVAPTVTSVNASTANGTYKTGDVVSVQVNFSEAVTVTGTPQLTLETGTTDEVVNYASGSGTSTLTFTYTVQAGDVSADLDYQSTTALALNGGTIKDAAGNSATLTLAAPGAAGSLGNNKAIVIDAVPPTVTSVNASTANGTYKTGDVISVQVNFSEAVTVTGTPQLTLETGTTDEVVNYASGSGTSTLTFTYTVQAGDVSADLDYQSTTALALNGGTIKDAAGNNATLTLVAPGAANSLGNNKAIVVDGIAPTVTSINRVNSDPTNATSVDYTVTFSESVTGVGISDFSLTSTGTASGTISSITGSGTTYTITVNSVNATGTLRLDLKASGTGITDGPGNSISGGYTSGQTYTIIPNIVVGPTTIANGTVGTAYSQLFSTSNGTAPYTYTVTAGALPDGLTLSGNSLLGTPTAGGTFNFTITSTDSSTGAGPYSGSRAYTLTINAPTIVLNPAGQALPAASPIASYNQTQGASGGTAPYSYAITAGALPAGITMASDGTFSGTPTVLGTFNFTVTATDSSTGTGPYTQTILHSITVSGPILTVSPPSPLPAARVGVAYSQTITASATGSTGPYTFTRQAGTIPPGLTLAADGTLSGTPTAVGSFAFAIRATDSSPSPGPYGGTRTYAGFVVSAPTIVVGPSTIPDGIAGVAYSQNIIATGGTAPYAYAITTGALPAGITLSSAGLLSGTSTVAGTFTFTVTATDATTGTGAPYSAATSYTVTFAAPTISLAPTTLPAATVGMAYSQTVTASGGTSPHTYAVTAGALPAGLTLAANGTLSGTATAGGTFNFTVTATDALSFTGSQAYTLTSNAPTLVLAPTTLPAGTIATAYSQSVTASGGTSPYTYAVTTGTLPAGLALATNGTISGTPTAAGTFNFTVTATDASTGTGPYTGPQAYSITIGKANQTITFADIIATYGDAPVTLTGTASSGLGVTYTSSNTSVATVTGNTLTILAAGTATITASQAGNANYNAATDVPKTLTVNKKAIAITADAKTKVYGAADPALTYQITSGSLVGTDAFTGTLTRDAGEAVNTYAIKQGTLALNSNYTLTYTGANLTIGQAALLAKATNQTKTYGAANPAFTVTYTGFANGDTEASLTTKPTVTTTATATSPVGSYPLTIAGGASPNYTITYSPGTLTVNPAILTVTADNKSRNYGVANPAFTVTYSGFTNGDDVTKLTTAAVAVNSSTTTTAPGSYPITASGAASPNYTFNYVAGTLTIVPLTNTDLTSLAISSGSLSPAFNTNTFAYNVTVDNATANLTLTPTFAVTASATVNGTTVVNGNPSFGMPLNVGNNIITLIVTAQDGVTKKTYTLNVYRGLAPASITATNILTPNGDGKNDYWIVKDIELYPQNKVTVYDKAGRVVYTKVGYRNEWDGTLSGAPLAQGTYYYTVNLGPYLPDFKGFITILKDH